MISWSIQEESFLRDNAGRLTCKEMAAELGRSPNAIQCKAKNLKITIRKPSFWLNANQSWREAELAFLKKHAATEQASIIAQKLKRPVKEIRAKCKALELEVWQSSNWNHWSDEDTAQLIKFKDKNVSATAMGRHFKRSRWAIYSKLRKLGLVEPKENVKSWSDEEVKQLKKLKQTYSVKQVAEKFNRTEASVRAQIGRRGISARTENLGLKDLRILFGEESFVASMSDLFGYWVNRGLVITKGGVRRETSLHYLRAFFRKNPDVVDVYNLHPATLTELELDIDSWPEPPNFKYLTCSGFHPRRQAQAHKPVSILFGLYDKICVCPYCHTSLGKAAVTSYTNEWKDPKPFPYSLMFCSGGKSKPSRKHPPLYQICKEGSAPHKCRSCERGLLGFKQIFLESKPAFKDTLLPWGKVAWKNFNTLSFDALRYKANLIFLKL